MKWYFWWALVAALVLDGIWTAAAGPDNNVVLSLFGGAAIFAVCFFVLKFVASRQAR